MVVTRQLPKTVLTADLTYNNNIQTALIPMMISIIIVPTLFHCNNNNNSSHYYELPYHITVNDQPENNDTWIWLIYFMFIKIII